MTAAQAGPVLKELPARCLPDLERFVALVERWNPAVNLVSRSTVADIWTRHVADSAQLARLAPGLARSWVDLGSGGGFPGLVVAIIAKETRPGLRVLLIESDHRKAAFLVEAARALEVPVEVRSERAETAAPIAADVVSARAVASLVQLLPLAVRHLAPGGVALLPKGAAYTEEIRRAKGAGWTFHHDVTPSETDQAGVILTVKEIRHV